MQLTPRILKFGVSDEMLSSNVWQCSGYVAYFNAAPLPVIIAPNAHNYDGQYVPRMIQITPKYWPSVGVLASNML